MWQRTQGVPPRICYKKNQIAMFPTSFQPYQEVCKYSQWEKYILENEKLSLMVAWSWSVSISCFKVQSSSKFLANCCSEQLCLQGVVWNDILSNCRSLLLFMQIIYKAQSSIGQLLWFFYSGNSMVSGGTPGVLDDP